MFTAIGHLALCFGNAFLCQEIALITAIFITKGTFSINLERYFLDLWMSLRESGQFLVCSHYLNFDDFILRLPLEFSVYSHYLNFDDFILRLMS